MKITEVSVVIFGFVITVATAAGLIISAILNAIFLSPDIKRQTDVQLVELAIGILGKPPEENQSYFKQSQNAQTALRTWAVDVINNTSVVQFDEDAKILLVRGEAALPSLDNFRFQLFSEKLREYSNAIDNIKELENTTNAPVIMVDPVINEYSEPSEP